MENTPWDVVIIGGGAAGLSAALMLGRARRRTLVIDAGSPRNRFAAHMHGVLGHEGRPPGELLEQGRSEAAAYGVEFRPGTVERVEEGGAGVEVMLKGQEILRARALVVATGMADVLPEVPGLAERWGRSVLHCPYCHGWEMADQRLGVLITSPMGLHQAQLIRQWSDRVTVFTAAVEPLDMGTEFRLRSRGVDLVTSPVEQVLGESADHISAVRTADGVLTEIDALFTAGTPRPYDAFLSHLGLEAADTPMGRFLQVDAMGKTSSDRIWAIGNVTNPALTFPMCMGAGAFTGGAVNAALVTEDFDRAAGDPANWADLSPSDYWEHRYTASERMWSGRVNKALAEIAAELQPGRSLDLGCGEGADPIWLAQHGWTATGIDISETAIRRASDAARAAAVPEDRISFLAADMSTLDDDAQYDLVTASFLHSPVDLARTEILRAAAGRVAPGGHLLITSHATVPPWGNLPKTLEPRFLSPDEEVTELSLDPDLWTVRIAETRPRQVTGPHEDHAMIDDSIVLLQRR